MSNNTSDKEFKLSSWAIENKMTIYVMMGLFFIMGLSAYYNMPREDFPEIIENKILLNFSETKKIGISHSNGIELILPDEIIYIKGEGAYSEIHLTDGKKILASKNLKMFEENLAENQILESQYANFGSDLSI